MDNKIFLLNLIMLQRLLIRLSLCFVVFLATGHELFAQEKEFRRSSIKSGIGLGFNEGKEEIGIGLLYSVGWQKSYGGKDKLRLNPGMIIGGFVSRGFNDTRDQFYRVTSLGFNLHYDLIRYKSVSLVTTGGLFFNYSRGLLGTGGWPEENNDTSEYFTSFYLGGNFSLGIRVDPKKSKLAYEIRPFNFQVGNDYVMGYFMFGIDFKLKK